MPRALPQRDLSRLSGETYAKALQDAYDIGVEDGSSIPPLTDPAIKDPACDEDVIRAYLRGWEQGAGPLKETA